jgi:hypothetical protein
MAHLPKRLLVSTLLAAPLVLWTGGAFGGLVCPPAGPPAICLGNNDVGDLIIVDHAGGSYGLNPTSRKYYVFAPAKNTAEWGDIVVEPANPARTLVIGNVGSPGGIGIREFDECGDVVSADPVWGTFAPLTAPFPPVGLLSIVPRGLAFDPISGDAVAPDPSLGALFTFPQFPQPGEVDIPLPTTGAWASAETNGAVAFDQLGNLFYGAAGNGTIIQLSAAALVTSPITGTTLTSSIGTPALSGGVQGMVADAHGSLFVTGLDAQANGHVWKVNTSTGATTVWTSNKGPRFGSTPLPPTIGITIDANGDLWVVLAGSTSGPFEGVVRISSTTGQVLDFFPPPPSTNGVIINAPKSLAVYGVNLPAVRAACPGDPCNVNGIALGACLGGGQIDPVTQECVAPAGIPSNTWHTEPAPNGSWDWNCDGIISLEFVDLPTVPSPKVCGGTATTCNGSRAVAFASSPDPQCSEIFEETFESCTWVPPSKIPKVGQGCVTTSYKSEILQQGCN